MFGNVFFIIWNVSHAKITALNTAPSEYTGSATFFEHFSANNHKTIFVKIVSCWDDCLAGCEATLEDMEIIDEYQTHYHDVTMSAMASQITSLTIVYSTVYSDEDQRKHQSSASLAFVRGIHRGPVNFPHKWPVMRNMCPFDDVIMIKNTTYWTSCILPFGCTVYWYWENQDMRSTLWSLVALEIAIAIRWRMMTSLNGNIFRVTGPLWGESSGHRCILLTKASDAELWCMLWCASGHTVEQTVDLSVIWDATTVIVTSL